MRLLILFAALAAVSAAQQPPAPPDLRSAPAPVAELSTRDALILGLIEGTTEYLPISSTGHLLIATHAMGLESDMQLSDPQGNRLWYKAPSAKHPTGEPLTLKLAADTYVVVIQFGAIAAVALLYWNRLLSMVRGLLGRDSDGRRLLANVVIAFIPAAGIGFMLHRWIDENLFSIRTVIYAQVLGAGLMFYAEWWRRRRSGKPTANGTGSPGAAPGLTAQTSLRIGLLQCAALCPGTSRSMMTVVGGYFAGLDPRRAAEFSFLLGLVTLTAATGLKSYESGGAMIAVFGWKNVLLGAVVAAVSAAIAVRFLVHILVRHGLVPFAIYRIVTAAALAFWFLR